MVSQMRRGFEFILINDGATDHSGGILDECASARDAPDRHLASAGIGPGLG